MEDMQPSDGLIILAVKIGDPEVRGQFWSHVEEIPGERVTATVYQFSISDWNDGLWDEEARWMSELLEGVSGSVVVWKFVGGGYTRFSIGSGG